MRVLITIVIILAQLTKVVVSKREVEKGGRSVLGVLVEVLLPHVVQQVVRVEQTLRLKEFKYRQFPTELSAKFSALVL